MSCSNCGRREGHTLSCEHRWTKPRTPAQEAALRIIKNLSDRRGLRHEWDQIDNSIKDEIFEEWTAIVELYGAVIKS